MNKQHAHCFIPPLPGLVILFIFLISLSCNLLQAEKRFSEIAYFLLLLDKLDYF